MEKQPTKIKQNKWGKIWHNPNKVTDGRGKTLNLCKFKKFKG